MSGNVAQSVDHLPLAIAGLVLALSFSNGLRQAGASAHSVGGDEGVAGLMSAMRKCGLDGL